MTTPGPAPTGPAMISLERLTKRYPGQAEPAVRELDLVVPQGEIVVLVGPSGCGKTTMMQTLAGFLAPTTGAVSLDGRVVDGPGPERGVVFQQPALFPWMTVAANAGFGPYLRDNPETGARVERWLRTVGLW